MSGLNRARASHSRLFAVMADANVRRWVRGLTGLLFYGAMPALSAVNAAVGLLLPLLLSPGEFGRYAIVVTLFQYGLIFDFGLSQLVDRRVPALMAPDDATERMRFINAVLWTRLYIATMALVGGIAIILVLRTFGVLPFSAIAAALSLAAGIAFMLALGPASVYRASSQRRIFGNINIALMLVLALARPAGLLAGGITGSFLALALSYAALACYVNAGMPPDRAARPSVRACIALMMQGLPLFIASFVWTIYLTANRWVVSMAAGDVATGHFAFGSNVVTLIVGAVGSLAQFYYPRIIARSAAGQAFCVSPRLARDFCMMVAAVTVLSAVGMALGPTLVQIFYPKFLASIPGVMRLLLAVPALSVAAWLMPIALSTATRPWVEGLVVYPVALLVVLVATRFGFATGGITGASAGLVVSAGPLLLLQLALLRSVRILRWQDAQVILGAVLVGTALLAALAFA